MKYLHTPGEKIATGLLVVMAASYGKYIIDKQNERFNERPDKITEMTSQGVVSLGKKIVQLSQTATITDAGGLLAETKIVRSSMEGKDPSIYIFHLIGEPDKTGKAPDPTKLTELDVVQDTQSGTQVQSYKFDREGLNWTITSDDPSNGITTHSTAGNFAFGVAQFQSTTDVSKFLRAPNEIVGNAELMVLATKS